MPPTTGNGKICYLEIPTTDVSASAEFYAGVFGWEVRTRSDGSVAFDDTVGEVSGTWITDWPSTPVVGVLVHIMVDSIDDTLAAINERGGTTVEGIGRHLPELTARFADPFGNVFGLYQEPA